MSQFWRPCASTSFVLTSGIIQSGMIGEGAVNSGNIASGQIGIDHLASGVLLSAISGVHPPTLSLLTTRAETALTTYVPVARAVLDFSKWASGMVLTWNQLQVPAGQAAVRLYNQTDATELAVLSGISTIGIQTLAVANPGGVKVVLLEHVRLGGAGKSEIEGAVLEN